MSCPSASASTQAVRVLGAEFGTLIRSAAILAAGPTASCRRSTRKAVSGVWMLRGSTPAAPSFRRHLPSLRAYRRPAPPVQFAAMKYWLMKCEPSAYSIDDLARDKTTSWEGVRNYQARNFMREMKKGDRVLFYASNADPSGVTGVAEVVREAYPDRFATQK